MPCGLALVCLAASAQAAGPVGLALTGADYGAFANATASARMPVPIEGIP